MRSVGSSNSSTSRVATLTPPGGALVRAGLEHADLYVSHVTRGFPEHQMGCLPVTASSTRKAIS